MSEESTAQNFDTLSVVVPAHNEERYIGRCLTSLLASNFRGRIEVIVASNGSTDGTHEIAVKFENEFLQKGWSLLVLEIETPGKIRAINEAEKLISGDPITYLDADIVIDEDLLGKVVDVYRKGHGPYVSGNMVVSTPKSLISRMYYDFWKELPFLNEKAPGAGFFVISRKGRSRWNEFPNIISDDTFARLNFKPDERIQVRSSYAWPLPEGFTNLVRARRRQDKGVREIRKKFPELINNLETSPRNVGKIALNKPLSFSVYLMIMIASKLTRSRGWERAR